MAPDPDLTQLPANVHNGDREAETRLMEAVYEELHRLVIASVSAAPVAQSRL